MKIKGELPDYNEKQKILYVLKIEPDDLVMIADRLLEKDRFSEAYDYIERSGDEKRLEDYMYKALDRGDFFNFERCARKLDMEIPPDMWKRLAINSENAQMSQYAVEAYRRAGEWEKADKIVAENPDFFGPVIEMEREKAIRQGKIEAPEPKK